MKIAICGRMRSGKDTVGDYLYRHYGYTRFAFGDELKRYVAEIFGKPLEGRRDLHQQFGQFCCQWKREVWLRKCIEKMKHFCKEAPEARQNRIVITDVRQPLEYEYCHSEGFEFVRVSASDRMRAECALASGGSFSFSDFVHETEMHVDSFKVCETLLNNGDIPYLYKMVDQLMEAQGIDKR